MTTGPNPQADESAWPLLPNERTWGAARLTLTLATTAAATWCYLIGESVAGYLGFIRGGLALAGGCMIGMLLVLLAAGPTCVRFGIDSVAATKPQFGSRGWVVPAAPAGDLHHRLEFSANHIFCQVRGAVERGSWHHHCRNAQFGAGARAYRVRMRHYFHCPAPRSDRRVPGIEYSCGACIHRTLDAVLAGVASLARTYGRPAR